MMAAIVAVSTAVFLWNLLASPSIAGRILSISIGAGIIAVMVVVALWPIEKRHLIDRVLFWVAAIAALNLIVRPAVLRSEEHTSELQSLMRISYAVFCLIALHDTVIAPNLSQWHMTQDHA